MFVCLFGLLVCMQLIVVSKFLFFLFYVLVLLLCCLFVFFVFWLVLLRFGVGCMLGPFTLVGLFRLGLISGVWVLLGSAD